MKQREHPKEYPAELQNERRTEVEETLKRYLEVVQRVYEYLKHHDPKFFDRFRK